MSVVEDVRKIFQDFLAPELRAIAVRMEGLEKQRVDDRAELLRAFEAAEKQRVVDKSELLQQRAENKAEWLRLRAQDKTEASSQRAEDESDILRAVAELKSDLLSANAHMEKRFELVVDYTKVLQRVDRLEEAQQSKSH